MGRIGPHHTGPSACLDFEMTSPGEYLTVPNELFGESQPLLSRAQSGRQAFSTLPTSEDQGGLVRVLHPRVPGAPLAADTLSDRNKDRNKNRHHAIPVCGLLHHTAACS
jgi:hypothetical protein